MIVLSIRMVWRGDDFDIYAQRLGNLTEEVRLPLMVRKYPVG
jgi:hypothetical protein